MANLMVRAAAAADRSRILEISQQIWEGDDYVPYVLETWLADADGEVVVVELDGQLISFAHRTYLMPGYAWFEGLRTDPAYRNVGAAKAIYQYCLAVAQRDGAEQAGLSTYIENAAALHLIERFAFRRVAEFVYLEARDAAPVRRAACASAQVQAVPSAEALAFIQASTFLQIAHGHFPHGWKFYPFRRGPGQTLARMRDVLGVRAGAGWAALLCVGWPQYTGGAFTIDFLDGEPAAMRELLRHALYLAGDAPAVEAMTPLRDGVAAPALAVLREFGFTAWQDYQADVLVFEREV